MQRRGFTLFYRPAVVVVTFPTVVAAIASVVLLAGFAPGPELNAQTHDAESSQMQKLQPNDSLRRCMNRAEQPEQSRDDLIFDRTTWGNNPQEGQYRDEMERLLRLEVASVRKAIASVEDKYAELIRVKPELASKNYKEIKLEDKPGVWRDGLYVNSQKIIALHFLPENHKLDCIVLDALVQSIYIEGQWTRKLMRMYNPHIQTVELYTARRNYVQGGSLEKTSTEIQLQALRIFAEDLRSSLYMMDMEIAAHYDQLNRVNRWQMGL